MKLSLFICLRKNDISGAKEYTKGNGYQHGKAITLILTPIYFNETTKYLWRSETAQNHLCLEIQPGMLKSIKHRVVPNQSLVE